MVQPLFLGYKPVQHVTVLNTVGNCNTMVLYYKITGPPSYKRPVVDRNVVMRHMTVLLFSEDGHGVVLQNVYYCSYLVITCLYVPIARKLYNITLVPT